jgi:hypothetical protein
MGNEVQPRSQGGLERTAKPAEQPAHGASRARLRVSAAEEAAAGLFDDGKAAAGARDRGD